MLNTERLPVPDLAASLTGDVVSPADKEWDLARRAWNLAVDQRPALVAVPADAADVVAIVDFARANGLRVAPQGTGHNAAAIASLQDTILVSTQRMRGVEIDAAAQTARVQAGTLWLEVSEASSPHGLFPLSGSSPDVGVVGYTLGGGLSWLARKHGLAANNVTAIELVTPDGRLLRATADEHADLFWALRGGGGNFGVVTAMEFRLFPYGEVYAGMFLFPFERAREVLHAWHRWTLTAPEDVTTSMRLMHFPPLPELPEFLRGRSVAVIDGAFAGGTEEGAAAVAQLRALGPELDTWGPAPAVALSHLHMDPEEPMPYAGCSTFLGQLDEAALDTFAAHAQPGAPLLFAELRHLGGALARVAEGAGAIGAFDGDYLYFTAGLVPAPEMGAAVAAAGERALAALSAYETGSAYLNFVEHPTDTSTFYSAAAYERLGAVRAAVDPHGVMVSNHPVPAA
jgi:FAD/FMN-containing dehydrogenase